MVDTSNDGTTGVVSWSVAGSRDEEPISDAGPAAKAGQAALALKGAWYERDTAFKRFDDLINMENDDDRKGIETMITNQAKTLFGLAWFMVATSVPQRSVSVGSQGPRSQRRAGKSERALSAWWQGIDEERLWNGEDTWQHSMAYWMCLYGWYATLALTTVDHATGEPKFIAVPYDPAECYPEFGGEFGLRRFAHIYNAKLADAVEKAKAYGTYSDAAFGGDPKIDVQIINYWERKGNDVINSVMLKSNRWDYLKEPQPVEGLERIPVLIGPVGGIPSRSRRNWQSMLGSVLAENERIYKDFNKWLSFLMQVAKEHAKAPFIAHNLNISDSEKALRPADVRDESVVIETDDPEAKLERVQVGPSPLDVVRILTLISSLEQRGGFPETAYGSALIEISGFGISQLLQAAERRVGAQVSRLSFIDSTISKQWLTDFRDNDFEPVEIQGFEGGNPRKVFVEDFKSSDVPKKFKVATNIPIRMANDLMSRMAIARQAVGQEQVLDLYTALDEVLQMDDPMLIMDRISEDRARRLVEPLTIAMDLQQLADDIRATRKPHAEEVAKMIEQYVQQMLAQGQQQQGAQGAPPGKQVPAQVQPAEARGVSPDAVKAAMKLGPPPNRTAAEQQTGMMG